MKYLVAIANKSKGLNKININFLFEANNAYTLYMCL